MLSDAHRLMLSTNSGVTEAIIHARKYETIATRAELKRLGFSDRQARTPALLIPIWDVNGNIALYHCRPDQPRIEKGKPRKYEFPRGSRMALDVPPTVRAMLGDPSLPLWVTEGAKKGDALASQGCCVVSLIGVWNWRGTNENGGKTALPDWESIALNGRAVYLVFDSDVMTKPEVSAALTRLREFLKNKGASVLVVYLPSGPSGQKVGVDDFLVQGHSVDDLMALATPHLRPCPHSQDSSQADYEMTSKGLVWWKPAEHDRVPVPLTNFQAQIVRDIQLDDGLDVQRSFEIKVTIQGQEMTVSIPARDYAAMNWVLEHIGPRAIIEPGQSVKERVRVGIQVLSKDIQRQRVYTHTGWTQLEGGEWAYLHADGAIGRNGRVSGIHTELPENLGGYSLATPSSALDLQMCVRASLRFLDTAPDSITIPIYAAIGRAVLGESPFSLHVAGRTGVHKSVIAALAQQHFGSTMDFSHLPASWSSTANALELAAFYAKDALMVVDDFCPIGNARSQDSLHASAERLFRGQGNRSARQRLGKDCTLRAGRPPRGLILSTGEDIPRGHSLRARMLIIEIGPGDVDLSVVTQCQQDAAQGLYARAMAGYLQWLAQDIRSHQARRIDEISRLRTNLQGEDQHKRTTTIVAELLYGLDHFLHFAENAGALTTTERNALYFDRAQPILTHIGTQQQPFQQNSDPVDLFLECLKAAMASGMAHIADTDGQEPPSPQVCGWRHDSHGYHGLGQRIGWTDGDNLYLEPTVSYGVANTLAQRSQMSLTVTSQTLWKRLKERELLASVDQARNTNKVRQTLEGHRREVLHLHATTFFDMRDCEVFFSDQSDQSG
ncbi:MAG: DUF3854 domain-containing protein [Nitrospira sp.]|nr:DUF3854 domain-containing protein [Nitrospira sp.]